MSAPGKVGFGGATTILGFSSVAAMAGLTCFDLSCVNIILCKQYGSSTWQRVVQINLVASRKMLIVSDKVHYAIPCHPMCVVFQGFGCMEYVRCMVKPSPGKTDRIMSS